MEIAELQSEHMQRLATLRKRKQRDTRTAEESKLNNRKMKDQLK